MQVVIPEKHTVPMGQPVPVSHDWLHLVEALVWVDPHQLSSALCIWELVVWRKMVNKMRRMEAR